MNSFFDGEDAHLSIDGANDFADGGQPGEEPGGAEQDDCSGDDDSEGAPKALAMEPASRLPKGAMPMKAMV